MPRRLPAARSGASSTISSPLSLSASLPLARSLRRTSCGTCRRQLSAWHRVYGRKGCGMHLPGVPRRTALRAPRPGRAEHTCPRRCPVARRRPATQPASDRSAAGDVRQHDVFAVAPIVGHFVDLQRARRPTAHPLRRQCGRWCSCGCKRCTWHRRTGRARRSGCRRCRQIGRRQHMVQSRSSRRNSRTWCSCGPPCRRECGCRRSS